MQITPFTGLSMGIHLIIVGVYTMLGQFMPPQTTREKNNMQVKIIVSFCIVIAVFTFVILSTVFLLRASVEDSHSSLRVAYSYATAVQKTVSPYQELFIPYEAIVFTPSKPAPVKRDGKPKELVLNSPETLRFFK